jgi:hypothetical protein
VKGRLQVPLIGETYLCKADSPGPTEVSEKDDEQASLRGEECSSDDEQTSFGWKRFLVR